MASAAAARAAAWRSDRELADLQDLVWRQTVARLALHEAMLSRDVVGVRQSLGAVARGLLLPVEGRWAERELQVLVSEGAEQQKREEATRALAEAVATADAQKLEGAISVAQQAGLNIEEEITAAEMQLFSLRQQERRQKAEQAAWVAVEQAVTSDDIEQLLDVLRRSDGALPPERIATAQRKIPGMQARAGLRKELAAAMAPPISLQHLQHVLFAAKRSCLPQAEVTAAEAVFREAEAEAAAAKRRKAAAAKAEAKAEAVKKAAVAAPRPVALAPTPTPQRQGQQPQQAEQTRAPAQQASLANVTEPPPAASEAGAAPAAAAVAAPKLPVTPLEEAVLSGDRAKIQAAIAALKASGLGARDIHRLHTKAMSEFGHK